MHESHIKRLLLESRGMLAGIRHRRIDAVSDVKCRSVRRITRVCENN